MPLVAELFTNALILEKTRQWLCSKLSLLYMSKSNFLAP